MQNESQNIEYKESWGRGFKKIAERSLNVPAYHCQR